MVTQRSKDSLDGFIMSVKMFEYFFDVIFVVSELAICILKVLTKLFHFILDLLIKLFTIGDMLFASVDNLHKSCKLTKYIAVKVHSRRNNYNRVTFCESDDCDSVTSRPLTRTLINAAVSRSAVESKLTGKQTEDHTVFPVVKLHVKVELTRFKIGIITG